MTEERIPHKEPPPPPPQPKRRAPPKSTHLSVAQIVKKGSEPVVDEDTPAQPVFDASALREVLNAARNGERERVHALALSLRSVIDVQPSTHLDETHLDFELATPTLR